jgi:hypothetical protein
MIEPEHPQLSIVRQCALVSIGRSGLSICRKLAEKSSFVQLLPFNIGISWLEIPDVAAIFGFGRARGYYVLSV